MSIFSERAALKRRFCMVLLGGGLLAGCHQMPDHSNTLFFATSTTVGVAVEARTTADPGITLGYERTEGVIMPLLANTKLHGVDAPTPCSPATENCMFTGKTHNNDTDTYSVLATFGAKFGGRGTGTEAEANAGIAQYFATGLAARALAENGGAAVVATGPAVEQKRLEQFVKSGEGQQLILANQTARDEARSELVGLILAEESDESLKAKMGTVATTLYGPSSPLQANCQTRAVCAAYIVDPQKNQLGGDIVKVLEEYK